MSHRAQAFGLVVFAILAGCGHSGTVPLAPLNRSAGTFSQDIALSITTTGNFTEYSLPAGINPADLTRGPFNTLYFTPTTSIFSSALVYKFDDVTGHVTAFNAPAPYDWFGNAIISYNSSVTFVVVNHTINEDAFFFAHVTPTGTYSFTGAPYFEFSGPNNLALASKASLLFGYCIDPCSAPDDGVIGPARLTDFFVPVLVTPGPGGNDYGTTSYFGPPPPPTGTDSRVYVVSQTGAVLHAFDFPNGSGVHGITTGSDHNLWITEPGINKIARMTPSGVITQYKIPTANAGPDRIVGSYDFALFFTEANTNIIGRITTTGHITEYRIPTPNSHPTGITPCSPTHCGIHGGVWFTETNANKIGRFNAPI